jgi:hypothetical protein
MKEFVLILLSGLLLLALGCTKKSTEPEEKPAEDYTLQASQTIGSQGGEISADDFSLSVPQGAFNSNANLKLYASSKDQPFGNYGVSRTFRLEGLPDEYAQPLRIRIKYDGTLSNESYVALGRWMSDAILDTSAICYGLYASTDSSGYLVCELPAREAITGSYRSGYDKVGTGLDSPLDNFLVAITDYLVYPSSKGHFLIYYPSSVGETVDDLGAYLEAAYDTCERMGFNFGGPESRYPKLKPVKVTVRDLEDRWWRQGEFRLAEGKGEMEFNSEKMNSADLAGMRMAAGGLVFRMITLLYDPRVVSGYDNMWLHPSCYFWFMEKFTDDPDYVPSDFKGNEMDPFTGIGELIGISEGVSAVIKYLADRYGDSIVVEMLEDWSDGKTHSIRALVNSVPDPEYVWWPGFCREYIKGNVYNVKPDTFLAHVASTFDVASASDTLKLFSGTYRDLSAKMYRINLNYGDIDSKARIRFGLDATGVNLDYTTVMVFGLKGGTLEYFSEGTPALIVEGVRALTTAGYDLIAVVVNSFNQAPYNENSNIELEVEIVSELEMAYNWCRISIGYVNMHFSIGDTADYWVKTGMSWEGEGSFSGNTFTATWHDTEDSWDSWKISSGSLTVVVDPVRTDSFDVMSFSATKIADRPGGGYPETTSVSGTDVPFDEFDDFYNLFLRCLVVGTGACSHIGSFALEREIVAANYKEKVIEYQCDDESDLRIVFWEWHGE